MPNVPPYFYMGNNRAYANILSPLHAWVMSALPLYPSRNEDLQLGLVLIFISRSLYWVEYLVYSLLGWAVCRSKDKFLSTVTWTSYGPVSVFFQPVLQVFTSMVLWLCSYCGHETTSHDLWCVYSYIPSRRTTSLGAYCDGTTQRLQATNRVSTNGNERKWHFDVYIYIYINNYPKGRGGGRSPSLGSDRGSPRFKACLASGFFCEGSHYIKLVIHWRSSLYLYNNAAAPAADHNSCIYRF